MTDYSDVVETVVKKFIDTQGQALAVRQANKAEEIEIDDDGTVISIDGDGKEVLGNVLEQFKGIMGPVSVAIASRAINEEYGDLDLEMPDEIEEKL